MIGGKRRQNLFAFCLLPYYLLEYETETHPFS